MTEPKDNAWKEKSPADWDSGDVVAAHTFLNYHMAKLLHLCGHLDSPVTHEHLKGTRRYLSSLIDRRGAK